MREILKNLWLEIKSVLAGTAKHVFTLSYLTSKNGLLVGFILLLSGASFYIAIKELVDGNSWISGGHTWAGAGLFMLALIIAAVDYNRSQRK